MAALIRWKKIVALILTIGALYFGGAFAFRMYRMDPENEYYGSHLPSAMPLTSNNEEEFMKVVEGLTREPSFLERLFGPAEAIFRWSGF
jgi:hypothetical protein